MGKEARVVWLENLQFVGIDSTKHSVVLSAQDEENGTGISPSDLLLLALGGCASYDVMSILQKKRQSLTGFEVSVTADQEDDPPWTFLRIHVQYSVRGRGVSEKAVQDAIRLSEEKYCSVAVTLSKAVEITSDYTIMEEE
jgi:putative redox protein